MSRGARRPARSAHQAGARDLAAGADLSGSGLRPRTAGAQHWLALVLATLLAGCSGLPQLSREPDWPTPERGAVVSEHPLATGVGLETLVRGGNAADAAVATALALAVVYPQAGNLGGGGFALWVPHTDPQSAWALDFRETAPRRLVPELFLDADGKVVRERSLVGHLAPGVPGSPDGLEALQRRFGRLEWREVVEPAIRLARDGFEVDAWLAMHLRIESHRARLLASPAARALFYPGGKALEEGDLLRQPELARTLERYAADGADGFYSGDVAEAIVAEIRAGGGVMDHQDLGDYHSRWMRPLQGTFRGQRLITMPPPSSGGVLLLQVLAVLDGFPLDAERQTVRAGAESERDDEERLALSVGLGSRALHWWIEALRMGFADRAQHLGDPDEQHPVPVKALLSSAWIAERRTSIGERANPDVQPWVPTPREAGDETTHLSVLDRDGNAVSMTTTINSLFGSGVLVPRAGFLLNNEMDDFSIVPGVPNDYGLVGSEANQLAPGRRPLSSMTPTVVVDGDGVVTIVIGSPGGPRIITSVIEVLLRMLVYGQSLEEAIRAPRLHQQWKPDFTRVEPGWSPQVLAELEARGHVLMLEPGRWASVQGIEVERGGLPSGFSDPRRGGAAGIEGGEVDPAARPGEFE
ncbi:gamma-glutamyltransferase family protein [Engelhardtia mirabilis]|uniref:Gamma-glutamyltranspeptidase n=1 Tax=Engelhardtia mirabilis TaxID=2528011 RepID=A0A518BLT0_9BACT|nr:Gamma-glutamyltranspeptidase precursor [Planctomycetes bacterium Pla133]QDV02261.1 Gamma-glutamyltranspeptidase precursor [Planctomycetes bacterium Pla86]